MSGIPELIILWDLSKDKAAGAYRKTSTVRVEFAENEGFIDTLEGKVSYKKGDAILTGVRGEKWPVERDVFDRSYEPIKGSSLSEYRKKDGLVVHAIQIKAAFRIHIHGGKEEISGHAGDWLVQYSEGDVGIVENSIFRESYSSVKEII
jgi:hypothetical protein